MAILVTGGGGFIGFEVVRLLLERGDERLVIFSRNPSRKRLDDIADKVEIIRGDLGNFSHVLHAVKQTKPRAIYHLGAMLSVPSDADPAAALHTNAMGTFHVLEAARLFEVPQVLFSSSIGVYGLDIQDEAISDTTLQRPHLFYGATKVFGEHMGLFYKRKYGLDFRGIRYPSIIGPGVKTPGVAQYTSWVIEACAKGKPFTIWVEPETQFPVMYIKEAAQAMIQLAAAPLATIQTVTYIIDGAKPTPSAAELAEAVRAQVPGAQIDFTPDPALRQVLHDVVRPIDDTKARQEWGWQPEYDPEHMVADFLRELRQHPQRYD
jgi:nucleoside-diphosphate-sugar epimerase